MFLTEKNYLAAIIFKQDMKMASFNFLKAATQFISITRIHFPVIGDRIFIRNGRIMRMMIMTPNVTNILKYTWQTSIGISSSIGDLTILILKAVGNGSR